MCYVALFCIELYCAVISCVMLLCSVLNCTVLCCVLNVVAIFCGVLECLAIPASSVGAFCKLKVDSVSLNTIFTNNLDIS